MKWASEASKKYYHANFIQLHLTILQQHCTLANKTFLDLAFSRGGGRGEGKPGVRARGNQRRGSGRGETRGGGRARGNQRRGSGRGKPDEKVTASPTPSKHTYQNRGTQIQW